jgi:two-component system C4-dicarboxylate transport sensor histidine kinase DctB
MPAALENLGRIVSLTERIGFITAELRSFTRRKTPSPVQAELGSILDGSLLLLGADARGKVTVRATAAQRRRVLIGDRIRLEQVLINLIRNALDAVAGMPNPRVRLKVSDHESDLQVKVSDNGPGVDPAIRETLFAPFESAKPGGLGLGLAIARDIAREFDGDLTLESGVTPGATFLLTLKAA